MYLQCPQCQSVFEINPRALGAKGRTVNCAVCANAWMAKASALLEKMPKMPPPSAGTTHAGSGATHAGADVASVAHPDAGYRQAQAPKNPEQKPAAENKPKNKQGAIPPPDIASTQHQQFAQPSDATAAMQAQTQHLNFSTPLYAAQRKTKRASGRRIDRRIEKSIERNLKELISFSFSWAVWAIFVLVVAYLARSYPAEIMTKFPNARHLYERINLQQPKFTKFMLPRESFSLGKVNVTSEFRRSRDVLLVITSVENTTQNPLNTPILRGSFRNAIDEEMSYFHFHLPQQQIPPKTALEYRVNVQKPDPNSQTLQLTLLSDFEATLDTGENRLQTMEVTIEEVEVDKSQQ